MCLNFSVGSPWLAISHIHALLFIPTAKCEGPSARNAGSMGHSMTTSCSCEEREEQRGEDGSHMQCMQWRELTSSTWLAIVTCGMRKSHALTHNTRFMVQCAGYMRLASTFESFMGWLKHLSVEYIIIILNVSCYMYICSVLVDVRCTSVSVER